MNQNSTTSDSSTHKRFLAKRHVAHESLIQLADYLLSSNIELPENLRQFVQAVHQHPTDIRIINKLVMPSENQHVTSEPVKKLLVIDTETTGLNFETDELIEIGYALIGVNLDELCIQNIFESGTMLQEPSQPLSDEIIKLTGLTMADLEGHSFDTEKLKRIVQDADILIAHNSFFDRRFLEKTFEFFESTEWLCTFQDVNWAARGIVSRKLAYLAYESDFFFSEHRALNDVQAILEIITRENLIPELFEAFTKKQYILAVPNAPFHEKDTLKTDLQYCALYQNSVFKCWYTIADADSVLEKLQALEESTSITTIEFHEIPRSIMYSERVNALITGKVNLQLEKYSLESSQYTLDDYLAKFNLTDTQEPLVKKTPSVRRKRL